MSYPTVKMKDITLIKTGKLDSNAAVDDGAYPFFTCDPNTLKINNWAYDTEAVLLAGNNASGNYTAKYYKGKFNAYQRVYIIETADPLVLNIRYLCYALNQQLRLLKTMSSGSTTKFLTLGMLHGLDIPLPSIKVQEQIVYVLAAYDDLIENNQKQIKLLEEAAQRLYKEWFVDLRFPGHETTSITDGIPQGWEGRNIDDVFSVQYGKMLPTSLLVPNGEYPVYGANGVIGYYTKANCFDYVTLITSRGNGSGDVLRTHHKASFVTNNSFVVLPKETYGHFELPFAYHLMKTLDFKSICTGSAQPQLTNKSISMLNIIVPTPAVVKAFCNIANPMFAKIELLYKQIQAAAEARDRLLPKLMNGEIEA